MDPAVGFKGPDAEAVNIHEEDNKLRRLDLLVIVSLVLFWYALVPIIGAFISRRRWRVFRRRFDDLRLRPLLDYAACTSAGGEFRFTGGFESATGDHILWIRSRDLTIPVDLRGAQTYVLPSPEQENSRGFDPGEEAPERIRWGRISALAEGVKVFVGGALVFREGRPIFVSSAENPLLVIFYDGPDRRLTLRVIRAGRHKNEYFNPLTFYGLILGAFSLIVMAVSYIPRPGFRLTMITAFVALFTPLLPLIPPGLLFTMPYRRLWWRARIFRAYRDLARLPLRYFPPWEEGAPLPPPGRLPDGSPYLVRHYDALPPEFYGKGFPFILPAEVRQKKEGWYLFGSPPGAGPVSASGPDPAAAADPALLPGEPGDPFAVWGAVPGSPEKLARGFTLRAYTMEIIAWLILLFGIGVNIFFIGMILALLLF
jgi:hypothetical protein